MTGKEIITLMRKHKVTIKALAQRMGITQHQIREAREQGVADAIAARDWIEGITGKDPEAPAPEPIATTVAEEPKPEPMPSADRVTRENTAKPDLLLPRNLAGLVDIATDHRAWATSGVCLKATPDGYRAEATDGRRLVVVTGPHASDREDFTYVPDLADAQRGEARTVVSAADWKAAFGTKIDKGLLKLKPRLGSLAVCLGKDRVTLATGNLGGPASLAQAEPLSGHWPNTDRLLTDMADKKVKAEVRVDAKMLAELLRVASNFTDGDCHAVTLRVYEDSTKYISLRAGNAEGQKFTGLIVPLVNR